MDIKAIPTIEPLVNDLKDLHIGYYLKSNQFKKFCVRNGIENIWSQAFDIAKNARSYFSFDFDHEPFDCQDALILLLNHYFNEDKDMFYHLTGSVIFAFISWSDKKLFLSPIIEDFELLKFPDALSRQSKSLG